MALIDQLSGIFSRVGLMDLWLPFLLIFIIIFAILEKTGVLGEDKRNLNVGLAIIFALIVVVPHITGMYPGGLDPVNVINTALPSVGLVTVAVVSLMILIGVFAHKQVFMGLSAPGWIAAFSVIAIIFIFGSAANWWTSDFSDWITTRLGSDAIAIFIMLLVFGLIIAFVTSDSKDRESRGNLQRLGVDFGKLFGK